VSIPGMVTIKATEISAPPGWALLERQLIEMMEQAAVMVVEKYAEPGGAVYYADDVDDLYEIFQNWALFYAIGADDRLLQLSLQEWNAITRWCDESIVSRVKHGEFSHGASSRQFKQQIYREYYNWASPGAAEWHHMGEGNMAFYGFGVANPTISENVRRARRFAAMFIGEDPEAPNYDPKYKAFRSPIQTSRGPFLHATVDDVITWLQGARVPDQRYHGVRASLYPVVKELEPDWYENPARRDEIVRLFEKIVLNGDIANSLGATALVTNAYLYTGDEKYKQWVLEYVGAWMDRMRANNGIIPDNIGPTGKIGEHRDGQWWGGLYGWNCYCGTNILFHSLTIGAECAVLLTGDFGYLDLLRSQIELVLKNANIREDGQVFPATRYGPEGWGHLPWSPTKGSPEPLRMQELAHLYHASMSREDYELITRVREGDKINDWNQVQREGEKNRGTTERARFQYYDGKNPDWPEKILRAEYQYGLASFEAMRRDSRDVETIISENAWPGSAVVTKGLTQVTMGAPQSVYNGGLLRATVRYFDQDRARPGLPADVAALVDKLGPDCVGIQLVNLSTTATRNVIVQAGAFGEHQFTEARFLEESQEGLERNPDGWARADRTRTENVVPVEARYFAVHLPPSTTIHLDAGMRRFVNRPTYAFPWHGDKIPVPFQ